jgi:predicted transcriptional regulator
MKWRATLS